MKPRVQRTSTRLEIVVMPCQLVKFKCQQVQKSRHAVQRPSLLRLPRSANPRGPSVNSGLAHRLAAAAAAAAAPTSMYERHRVFRDRNRELCTFCQPPLRRVPAWDSGPFSRLDAELDDTVSEPRVQSHHTTLYRPTDFRPPGR